jgi:hypothetical protein
MYSPIDCKKLYEILNENYGFKNIVLTISENLGFYYDNFYDYPFKIIYSLYFLDYRDISKPNIPIPIMGFLLELIFAKTISIKEYEIRDSGIYYNGNRLPYDIKILSNEESKKIFENFLDDLLKDVIYNIDVISEDLDEVEYNKYLNFKNNILPELEKYVPKIAEYLVYTKNLTLVEICNEEYINRTDKYIIVK